MEAALEIARRAERILLAGHLRADGDCLGSECVLYHAFRSQGKQAWIVNPDPPDPRYAFLGEHTPYAVYAGPGSLPEYDALFVSDCSMLRRLGGLGAEVARRPAPRVVVDHHPLEDADREVWTACVHDVAAPASGLLALRFAQALGADLPACALDGAFVALATDTGWFKYGNAKAAAWRAAAGLVEAGVDAARLHGQIYQSADAGRPRGIAAALATLEYERDGRVALAWLSQERLAEAGGTLDDTDEVLDLLRSVAEVEVVAFVLERSPGRLKASLRSQGGMDVNRVARRLGGGGHARAAGLDFPPGTSMEAAVAKLRTELLAEFDAVPAPAG